MSSRVGYNHWSDYRNNYGAGAGGRHGSGHATPFAA
jgi:hypothetical protein